MTQTETITWHKYPEEKPTSNYPNSYMCQSESCLIRPYFWSKEKFETNDTIIAWAELPKGWK